MSDLTGHSAGVGVLDSRGEDGAVDAGGGGGVGRGRGSGKSSLGRVLDFHLLEAAIAGKSLMCHFSMITSSY